MTHNTFKHSGALGDLIYSLPVVKHFGGGSFFLHLNQMDWIGQHYYGSQPVPFHQGRMTRADFDYMESFMLVQDYITSFGVLHKSTEITHNLDRFRPPFVGHPGNYISIYSSVFGLTPEQDIACQTTPWLRVSSPVQIPDRPWVINRSTRWIPPTPGPQWSQWMSEGLASKAVFVGLESEHDLFCQTMDCYIPWHPTRDQLELASVIAGAERFIGNQSQCLALAIGLGVEQVWCEARQDIPLDRNECYFPANPRIKYF
jgi:hypothetical protein